MLPNNGEAAAIPSSSSSTGSKSTEKSTNISRVIKNIQKVDWNKFVKNIDWDISDDNDDAAGGGDNVNEVTQVDEAIPSTSTSNNNDTIILNANILENGTTKKVDKIVDDGIQPCSSKTPIRSVDSSQQYFNNNHKKTINGILNKNNRLPNTKTGLHGRWQLTPQLRQQHPFVAYKRFRDALSGTMKKKFKLGNDPLQHELLNHQKHMNDLIIDRVKDKMHFEIEKIRERDKISRRMIEERYTEEREKIETQYEAAVTQLAEKMIAENEEERRQLEAELAAMGAGGEVPPNFSYPPNRKQLRRRTGNPSDPLTEHSDKLDPYVPIYQVHWIDHREIADDLDIVDYVLQNREEPAPDRHISVQILDGKLIIDGKSFNRGLNQIMIVKSRTFGEFPAIILSLGENCLTVRSVIKGDPRHITITKADLESGRVKISKKGTT